MAHRTTVGHVHLYSRWVRIALSPSSPLRFRTAGFPQYGSKAGIPDEAFPAMHGHRTAQFAPAVRVSRGRVVLLAQSRGHQPGETPPFERTLPLCPRGPRSGPGSSVPVHHRLTSPIRPTRQHMKISPHSGLYPMPSLCPQGLGCQRVVPCFRSPFLPDMPSSTTPGSSSETFAHSISMTLAFAPLVRARRSRWSHHPFLMGARFRGFTGSLSATACQFVSLLDGSDQGLPQPQRRLHSGFQRIGHPFRRRVSLRWHLGILHRRDFHPLERQLASLHTKGRAASCRPSTP